MSSLFGGRVAFITGAGSGIGRAVSRILARDGARVVATDINLKGAQDTVNSLINPSEHLPLELDVSNANLVRDAFQSSFNHFGKTPTYLVQAAGIVRDNFLWKLEEKQFMDVININLKGTFLVQQEMVKGLEEKEESNGAAIVNISSIVAKHGNMGQGNYSASKAGVEAFTKTTAKELGKKGIRVNCVAPGFIETPMIDSVPDKLKSMILFVTPLQRMGKPEEVAEVVSFLLSDRSSYMTGSVIEVAGGFSA